MQINCHNTGKLTEKQDSHCPFRTVKGKKEKLLLYVQTLVYE